MRRIDRVGLIEAATCMREGVVLTQICAGILGMFPGRCAEKAHELYQGAEELATQARAMEAQALAPDGCEAR
jgi:hypothetical protein